MEIKNSVAVDKELRSRLNVIGLIKTRKQDEIISFHLEIQHAGGHKKCISGFIICACV